MPIEALFYLVSELAIIGVTAYTTGYMYLRLRKDRWYFLHALPLLIYSLHVIVYYVAVIIRRNYGIEVGFNTMYWSLALRLHASLMVYMMARTVILCQRTC